MGQAKTYDLIELLLHYGGLLQIPTISSDRGFSKKGPRSDEGRRPGHHRVVFMISGFYKSERGFGVDGAIIRWGLYPLAFEKDRLPTERDRIVNNFAHAHFSTNQSKHKLNLSY